MRAGDVDKIVAAVKPLLKKMRGLFPGCGSYLSIYIFTVQSGMIIRRFALFVKEVPRREGG